MTRTPTRRLGLGALAAVLVLSACAPEPPAPDFRAAAQVDGAPVTFAVVGDSITAWDSTDPLAGSWVEYAVAPRVRFEGGWAVPGATTANMRDGVGTVPDAEVLVVMAGTNDFLPDFPDYTPDRTCETIRAIVAETGIPHVVLSAIAPNDFRQELTDELNRALRALAASESWTFVDPWSDIRRPDGGYATGATLDGIHPVAAIEAGVGAAVRSAIVLAHWSPLPR